MLKARGLGPVALATSIAFVFGQDAQMAANGNGVTDRELEVKDQLRQLQDRLRIFEERSAAINAALTAQFEERYAATNAALEAALDRITALEAVREEPTVSKAAYERPRRRLSSLDHNQVSGIQFKPAGGFNAEVGDDGKPQIYGDSSGELYFSSKLTGVVNLKEDIMEKIDAAEATIAAQADLIQQLNTTAASTYLTQASADSTYLTQVTGSGHSIDALQARIAALERQVPESVGLQGHTFAGLARLPYLSATRAVTTLAGGNYWKSIDGHGISASFKSPRDITVSPVASHAFVADWGSSGIRQIDITTGVVTTIHSDKFYYRPQGVAVSPDGSLLFVADTDNNNIHQVTIGTNEFPTTIASGISSISGKMATNGTLLFVSATSRIHQIVLGTNEEPTTLAGGDEEVFADGTGTSARFYGANGLALSPDSSILYVADGANKRIRQIVIATRVVTTLAGSGADEYVDGPGVAASFGGLAGLAISPDGSLLFVTDSGNSRIRQIVTRTGMVTTIAGDGSTSHSDGFGNDLSSVSFRHPQGIAISTDGKVLFVADGTDPPRVRQITA